MKLLKNNPLMIPFGLFVTAFLLALIVLVYENVYRIDEWKNIDITTASHENIKCKHRFDASEDNSIESFIALKESIQILTSGGSDMNCFSPQGKIGHSLAQILVITAYALSVLVILRRIIRKTRFHFGPSENHVLVIGLGQRGRALVENLLPTEKVVVIEKEKDNFFIDEIERLGVVVIIGDASQQSFLEDARAFEAKEIYLMSSDDSTNLEVASILFENMIKEPLKSINERIKPLDVYIHLHSRYNRELFDRNGLYNLKYDALNFYPFSIDEIIATGLFEDRPLTTNLNNDTQKYMIVDFNNMAQEILYHLLKTAYFYNNKTMVITVFDETYEKLRQQYAYLIEKGSNPYAKPQNNHSNNSLWELSFEPMEKLYDPSKNNSILFEATGFKYNRIILCNKDSNKSLEVLSIFKKYFHQSMDNKKTLIQFYNPYKTFGNHVIKDNDRLKDLFAFGEIPIVCTPSKIKIREFHDLAKLSNDIKEIYLDSNLEKVWENLDLFTRESNFTEKSHMDIKLDLMGLQRVRIDKQNTQNENIPLCPFKESHSTDTSLLKDMIKELSEEERSNEALKDYLLKDKKTLKKQSYFNMLLSAFKSSNSDAYKKVICDIYKEIFEIQRPQYSLKRASIWLDDYEVYKEDKESLEKILYLINAPEARKVLIENKEIEDLEKLLINKTDLDNNSFERLNLMAGAFELYRLLGEEAALTLFDQLAQLEHTRWNAFHILHGWSKKADITTIREDCITCNKRKDTIAKEHYDLCDWETLMRDDSDVICWDYKNIYHIPYMMAQLGYVIEKKSKV